MNEPKLRWGILSTAEIAQKNWRAIRNSGNGIVTAVASREAKRSRDFIARCQREVPFDKLPRALGNRYGFVGNLGAGLARNEDREKEESTNPEAVHDP